MQESPSSGRRCGMEKRRTMGSETLSRKGSFHKSTDHAVLREDVGSAAGTPRCRGAFFFELPVVFPSGTRRHAFAVVHPGPRFLVSSGEQARVFSGNNLGPWGWRAERAWNEPGDAGGIQEGSRSVARSDTTGSREEQGCRSREGSKRWSVRKNGRNERLCFLQERGWAFNPGTPDTILCHTRSGDLKDKSAVSSSFVSFTTTGSPPALPIGNAQPAAPAGQRNQWHRLRASERLLLGPWV